MPLPKVLNFPKENIASGKEMGEVPTIQSGLLLSKAPGIEPQLEPTLPEPEIILSQPTPNEPEPNNPEQKQTEPTEPTEIHEANPPDPDPSETSTSEEDYAEEPINKTTSKPERYRDDAKILVERLYLELQAYPDLQQMIYDLKTLVMVKDSSLRLISKALDIKGLDFWLREERRLLPWSGVEKSRYLFDEANFKAIVEKKLMRKNVSESLANRVLMILTQVTCQYKNTLIN